jgi:hypothetical protein
MKKSLIYYSTVALLITGTILFTSLRSTENSSEKKTRNSITGTWQLDSYKYGPTSSSFAKVTANRPHIKLITETTFLWATYNADTKEILESAGGVYTLDGDNYTESIDYGYNMDNILGTKSQFKVKVEDGMLYITGDVNTGNSYHIEEIWLKVK